MENSPILTGPDLFAVKLHFRGGRYHNVRLKRVSSNFYQALAEIAQVLPDNLNRFGDRVHVKAGRSARRGPTLKADERHPDCSSDSIEEYTVEYYDRP
jgi:ribosome-associated translation inhibitor RaiA